jgi:hypothetical protein
MPAFEYSLPLRSSIRLIQVEILSLNRRWWLLSKRDFLSFPRLGLNIGLMPLSGFFEILIANDIVPVKNGPSLMAGDLHGYYLGGSRSNEISGCFSPEIVDPSSFEASFPKQT